MHKVALVECLTAATGMGKEAVDSVFEEIGEAVASGEDTQIIDFATFCTGNRPARTGRNHRMDESMSVAASTVSTVV